MAEERQITKKKNEGRVASGKRLAEWNRKNKEDLIKNKDQVEQVPASSGGQVEQVPNSSRGQVPASHVGLYGGFILLLIAGGIYYLYTHRKAPAQPEPPKKQPKKYME